MVATTPHGLVVVGQTPEKVIAKTLYSYFDFGN